MAIIVLWRNCSSTHRGLRGCDSYSEITANKFEIKHGLRILSRTSNFFGNDKEDPHAHIPIFQQDHFYNEISRTGCPHHGFSELHQLDTFYNALNSIDQDSLNSAAGGSKAVNHDTEVTKDTMPPANNGSTEDVQPPVVQIQSRNPNPEPTVAPVERSRSSRTNPNLQDVRASTISITEPIGILKTSAMEGKFLLPADFVVVDFEPDPREAITFNLDQTSKYTADYNHMTVNKIDVIDDVCDIILRVLGFSNMIASGNPTPYFEPIVSTASPNLTPFGDSDFLLMEEADSFLALEDDPNFHLKLSNLFRILRLKPAESSVDNLPRMRKNISSQVSQVPQSTIAWKLSDIKGVSKNFVLHKILMEEDYEPPVTKSEKGYTQKSTTLLRRRWKKTP
ncbi:hypothetical protein Tco_0155458 [Tanacetum coccineum]